MPLTSILFKNCKKLQACAIRNSDHVTQGARGEHVARIQKALNLLDDAGLDLDGIYGPLTASAVLAYKRCGGPDCFSIFESAPAHLRPLLRSTLSWPLNRELLGS